MILSDARLPRFRRAAQDAPQLQITERDTELMRQIARHRFLRSSHLIALTGGSRASVLRGCSVSIIMAIWPEITPERKRQVIEQMVKKITIGDGEIDMNLV